MMSHLNLIYRYHYWATRLHHPGQRKLGIMGALQWRSPCYGHEAENRTIPAQRRQHCSECHQVDLHGWGGAGVCRAAVGGLARLQMDYSGQKKNHYCCATQIWTTSRWFWRCANYRIVRWHFCQRSQVPGWIWMEIQAWWWLLGSLGRLGQLSCRHIHCGLQNIRGAASWLWRWHCSGESAIWMRQPQPITNQPARDESGARQHCGRLIIWQYLLTVFYCYIVKLGGGIFIIIEIYWWWVLKQSWEFHCPCVRLITWYKLQTQCREQEDLMLSVRRT